MKDLEQMSIRRLLQWACSCEVDRLRVNDGYPRSANVCDITEKGRYLHSVLCGTDVTVMVVNTTSINSFIVDGASRLVSLVDFHQGRLPMVLPWHQLPDAVSCHPYGVARHVSQADRYPLQPETLVESFFQDLNVELRRSFLNAVVDIRFVRDLSVDMEQRMYGMYNDICPSSPTAESSFNEASVYVETAELLPAAHRPALAKTLQVLELIGGARAQFARANVLQFARSLADELAYSRDTHSVNP